MVVREEGVKTHILFYNILGSAAPSQARRASRDGLPGCQLDPIVIPGFMRESFKYALLNQEVDFHEGLVLSLVV